MLKYFVPIYGIIRIWKDIPHTTEEYRVKPLQGDIALMVITVSFMSTLLFLLTLIFIF